MDDYISIDRKMKLNQIKTNLIIQHNKTNVDKFYNENYNIDNETLFTICLSSFVKNIEDRDKNDQILISYFLYQIKKFINLFKVNMMNVNEKLDIKFYDSLRFISSNIIYSKFNSNRLLMRFGEEGKKFYLLLKGEVAILIPIKKIITITINEYKRYIALLIIYKEFKLLLEVLKENNSIYNMDLDFLDDNSNYFNNINLLQNLQINDSTENSQLHDKHLKNLIQLLDLYLTDEEKKFYNKYVYNKVNKYQEEYDDGIYLSQREYTSRINQYSEYDFENLNIKLDNLKKMEELKKEEEEGSLLPSRRSSFNNINLNDKKSFLIYEYHKVTELSSGEMFGDVALSSSTSLRTATIITITECHFGFLTEHIYSQSIKEYNEKNRKNMICYLCNVPLLNSFSYKTIDKKYFNNFVFKGAKRNEIILKAKQLNKNIIFFKEGIFEISFKGTIQDIYNIINYYHQKLENINKKKTDIDEEIVQNVFLMNKQKGKIDRLFFNDLNNEYDIKVFLVDSPNIFGMSATEREEHKIIIEKGKKKYINEYFSFFEIKCNSILSEYVLLDKNLFDKEIKRNDKTVKARTNIFLKEFYGKLIKRLLIIRYGKIWNLFIQNGIYNEQNGVNIDWSKIELNQDFIKGINKLIETVNEFKFLSNDVEKNLNKYLEEKRQKFIEEKQQLKSICHKKYIYNKKVKDLLNKNDNEKDISNEKENENVKKINTKRNNFINTKINQKGSQLFNNIWINKNLEKIRNREMKKNKSSISINRKNAGKSSSTKCILPSFDNKQKIGDYYKINALMRNKKDRIVSENKVKSLLKKNKRKISFYSPKINFIHSDNNLNLHYYLYDTFKKFGESHSSNVIKNIKNLNINGL